SLKERDNMKKINKVVGEAKVSVREKMGKRDSLVELPDYRIKTKSLEDIRNNIKDFSGRLAKQSRAHQALITDNCSLADCFSECGNQLLQEEGHTSSSAAILGPTFTILGDMHNQFEILRTTLAKGRYEKARISLDASTETYKTLKRRNLATAERIQEAEQDFQIANQQFSDIAMESLFIFEDIIDKVTIESVDTVYDYIKVYEDYFAKSLDIVRAILPNIERQKLSTAKLRTAIVEKKKKRVEEITNNNNMKRQVLKTSSSGAFTSPEVATSSTSSSSSPATQFFGISLETLQERDKVEVPNIVYKAVQYLERPHALATEGLFRVSANQRHFNEMKEAINNGSRKDFEGIEDPHMVTSFIKCFLRELPTPLLTYDLFKPLVQPVVDSIGDEKNMIVVNKLASILKTLPRRNQTLCKIILGMLSNISANKQSNKMTSSNLAVVLAPNMLYPLQLDIESITEANATIEYMIRNYQLLYSGESVEAPETPPRLNRQSVLLLQHQLQLQQHQQRPKAGPTSPTSTTSSTTASTTAASDNWRKSVVPPTLPAKPSLNRYSMISTSTPQLGSNYNNKATSPPLSPPSLPPKPLSNSGSNIPPPQSSNDQSSNRNSINLSSNSISNNRRSVAAPLPPIPTSPSSSTTTTTPTTPTLPTKPNSNSNNSSSSSARKRPQAIKISPLTTTTLTSPDGTTAKYNLLDDTFSFSDTSGKQTAGVSPDDDLIH
ncbi:hypothetical protein SAMD00019534_077620, partial [Acytostelium subglobosum LB1]|uniref:hypothetical protein n=1 Tax=Acytostelium subglobosum LB1 TaxID=1410327 RepID=UPI000644ED2E